MSDKQSEAEALSFGEALARLEAIVEELEGGQMSLEESLQRFEEGLRLRTICLEKLRQAEARVEEVLAEAGEEQEKGTPE